MSFNMRFVAEVEKYPELYDFTNVNYSRKDVVENAWKEISKLFKLPVADCKDKWKNIRTTFVRKLRHHESSSGSKVRKPYYLNNAMQFTLPFVRRADRLSKELIEEYSEEADQSESSESNNLSVPEHPKTPDSSLQPSLPTIVTTTTLSSESSFISSEISDHSGEKKPFSQEPSSPQQSEQTLTQKKVIRKRKGDKISDYDTAFVEYFATKKPKIVETSEEERREPMQQFLQSLLPDLMTMTDAQLRAYKRRSLLIIDEILGATPFEIFCNQDVSQPVTSIAQSPAASCASLFTE